jgi:hypothetical protein
MKDLRLHLWDIFVYMGAGSLAVILCAVHEAWFAPDRIQQAWALFKDIPTPLSLIFALGFLMLLGALLESIANYYEKTINWFVSSAMAADHRGTFGANAEAFVRKRFTDPILGEGTNPITSARNTLSQKA